MTFPRKSRRLAGKQIPVLLSCLLTLPAMAAEEGKPEAGGEEAVSMAPVVVSGSADHPYAVKDTAAATRLPLTLKETPQSVTVVTRERMDDQNLQSTRDVLDNTTGIYSYAYDTERVVFTARGFVIDNLLYDNVPGASVNSTGSVDETIDTAFYDRIEIVRGATGLLSGAGSPSAAINLVRKRADSRTFEASTSLSAGSWDDYRAVADLSTPLTSDGDVRARVVGVYQNRESFQDLYSKEHQAFYGTVNADLGPNTLLTLGYDYLETQPQGNTWGSFPLFFSDGTPTDWRRSITTATDWSFWNKRTETQFAELQQRFDNGWSIRSTLTHRDFGGDLALFYVYGFPDPVTGEGLVPFAYRSKESGQQNSLDIYANGPFELFGRKHELVVGATGSRLKQRGYVYAAPDSLPDTGNFFEWDGSYPEPDFADTADLITHITTDQAAVYAAARFSLADRLKLIAGLRHTKWKTDYFDIYSDDRAYVHEHNPTVPYAGLIYDLTPQWSAFSSYTEIFKPQNSLDREGRFLDPTTGQSVEVGIKGEHFDGRLNTALTLFDTRQDKVAVTDAEIDPDTGSPYTVPGRPALAASVAVDGTRSQGFELEASGQLAKGWNLSVGWSNFELEGPDGEAIRRYVPRTLIRTYTSWNPQGAWNKLTLGGGVNWQSKSTAVPIETPTGVTSIEQRDVTLVSLLARYQVTRNLSLQLNGNNLLDKTYYVLDEYGNLYYGTPANGTVTVNFRF
ncbi:TonB-dependent siderophore receptor [Solimonas sp. K1W22B-7]|uniref:TonB-dependent siderophore receptor n=1 Tax=Solimonas sp. K1W22B-7 TaxID=2303331 RepID=UPI000E3369F7|nr:TonB-dependent siderophore receptor [Solimonas sp. K1W22B-7]AXQ30104.1 TonB-dependent siderophore receptor [Solimonas sp. K1W22B-7]